MPCGAGCNPSLPVMKPLFPLVLAGSALAGLAACDSPEEQARKHETNAKAEALEQQAKAVRRDAEAQAESARLKEKEEVKAIKDSAESTADQLEQQAKAVRKEG